MGSIACDVKVCIRPYRWCIKDACPAVIPERVHVLESQFLFCGHVQGHPRRRVPSKRLIDEVEQRAVKKQRSTPESARRSPSLRRRLSGFGSFSRHPGNHKKGRNAAKGGLVSHSYKDRPFRFNKKRDGAIHGMGLFSAEPIPGGVPLGFFSGKRLNAPEAAELRRKSRSLCLVLLDEEEEVYINGAARGFVSPFRWINSVQGTTGRVPNVEFVRADDEVEIWSLADEIAADVELLADYDL